LKDNNHYIINLNKIDQININRLIDETNMTWDKYLGVCCSQRDGKHGICLDVEDSYYITFKEADIPLVIEYLKLT